jgi:adenylate cyclase
MALEIERKFIALPDNEWLNAAKEIIVQGYLSLEKGRTIRVRKSSNASFLTIKTASRNGVRDEYEYEIPHADADEILNKVAVKPLIFKTRHTLLYKNFIWEVDLFAGENEGLIVAEIELNDFDEPFEKPKWVGKEVTGIAKYNNSSLVENPFQKWKRE